VITSGDRFRVISENKIYTYSDPDMESYGFSPDGFDLEGQVTSAIDYVTTKNLPKIYEITGHDELLLAGSFLTAVNRENVEVSELSLVAAGKIPADARGLLILAPKEDYSEEEIGLLRTYMEKGGNLYVLLQWSEEPKERLNSFLSEYGIKVENGIVSEGDANLYFQEPYYLIPEIQETSVTEGLSGSMALSVMSVGMKVENEAAEIILKTTDHAFLKKSSETEEQSGKEEGDETGEFVLGVFLKKTVDVTEDSGDKTGAKVTRDAKLSVFASPYMTQETTNDAISGMNQKLFIQILGEMVSHKTPISIPTKAYTPRFVTVSESDSRFFGTILAGIIPGLTLIAGLVIWVVRRRR
jgi:ABC-2 type transport system permease protein